ncbi:MAG: class I SAM-dependent methyltransferase [Saprospiraceae bacterium]|nr:class I SAM-dependent methyltransferase [Saprospiraceae bacterium]
MDKSNGYEKVATKFISHRELSNNAIGLSAVRKWARSLPKDAVVLDLGCGTGIPISKVLLDEGMEVFGIDASSTLSKAFQKNFPNAQVACDSVEDSKFFNRTFDAIISWGLIFLLSKEAQEKVINKASEALNPGGKLLFTSPSQNTEWTDVLTGHNSFSLGAEKYTEILSSSGLKLIDTFEDEGGNHYYSAIKI